MLSGVLRTQRSFVNLFGMQGPIRRREYVLVGLVAMPLKYLVEAVVIFYFTGRSYSVLDFVNPLLSSREHFTVGAPGWLGMAWVLWSLPFLWLAVVLSVRRAYDAELSPWLGLLMFVPIANLLLMFVLAVIPTGYMLSHEKQMEVESAFAPPKVDPSYAVLPNQNDQSELTASLLGLAAGAAYLVIFVVISVYGLGSYGAAMFFGTPVITGAVASYILNRNRMRGVGLTLIHSTLTMAVACAAFLLMGLEGIICIVMAMPIMIPLGLFGALVGRSIACSLHRQGRNEQSGLLGCMLVLPFIAGIEIATQQNPTFEVVSSIKIDAPIENVWENVIHFSDISAEPSWYFKMGIAYPTRAHIDGSGVGAQRFCEFSTGTFVEPITAWERPTKLSFNVSEQPEPMFELTPYRHIHPPHLTGAFRSTRGEFRLAAIGPHSTLLEGSTWYQLDVRPLTYWSVWTDWILHRIHFRVLDHIKVCSEAK